MKIPIELRREWRDDLLSKLSPKSTASVALEQATKLEDDINYCAWCDEGDTLVLLQTAKEHCPAAAEKIFNDIKMFWSNRLR